MAGDRKPNATLVAESIPKADPAAITPTVAERRRQFASCGIMGPPGSGKTRQTLMVLDAMRRAEGDQRPVLMIDAQHGQGHDEADWWYSQPGNGPGSLLIIDWLTDVDPTCHPVPLLRYVRTIGDRYFGVAVDPFSRYWEGARDWKSALDSVGYMGGNRFASWGPVDEVWSDLIEWVQKPPCHVILAARMKERFEQTGGANAQPISLGLVPQWREETSYELGILVRLYRPQDHGGKFMHTVERTRGTQGFQVGQPQEGIVERFALPYSQWLRAGTAPAAQAKNPDADARWETIRDAYRKLPDQVRDAARAALIMRGLLTPDGKPNPTPGPRFSVTELDAFQGIVATAEAAAAGTDDAGQSMVGAEPPPPAPEPEDDGSGGADVDPGEQAHVEAAAALVADMAGARYGDEADAYPELAARGVPIPDPELERANATAEAMERRRRRQVGARAQQPPTTQQLISEARAEAEADTGGWTYGQEP